MKAVPIADPNKRKSEKDLNFQTDPVANSSNRIHARALEYREVEPGHFILTTDSGY